MKPTIIPILFLLITRITAQSGLTLTQCTSSTACKSPRICSVTPTQAECPTGTKTCRCIPETGLASCETAQDCPDNESCFSSLAFSSLVCVDSTEGKILGRQVGIADGSRLTLDACSIDEDCATGRTCKLFTDTIFDDCRGRHACSCLTSEPIHCSEHSACLPGERCALFTGGNFICISATVVQEEGLPVVNNSSTNPNNGAGLVLEDCETTADCLPPRKCLDISRQSNSVQCSEDANDHCVCGFERIPICTSDVDCTPGEACVSHIGTGRAKICISKAALGSSDSDGAGTNATTTPTTTLSSDSSTSTVPTTTDGTSTDTVTLPVYGLNPITTAAQDEESATNEAVVEEAVCVDADLLTHLESHELVFAQHRHARVLCDTYGSCATRGHIVLWYGMAMMMKSYCSTVKCEEKVVRVNSPRYRKGMVVKSRSDGLVFTTLAARFETKFEEHVLRAAIRVGL